MNNDVTVKQMTNDEVIIRLKPDTTEDQKKQLNIQLIGMISAPKGFEQIDDIIEYIEVTVNGKVKRFNKNEVIEV